LDRHGFFSCPAQVEWDKRWKAFPNKFLIALGKYHAVTLLLRVYEYVASKCCSEETLDKLTMDYVAASRTMARKVDIPNGRVHAFAKMTDTTFWSNLLITLADYSVHQVLFCYGYYKYYQYQQRKKKPKKDLSSDEKKQITKECIGTSSHLLASRGCGLVCSAVGAGIGTLLYPGWGTLMMSAMAESSGGMFIDDGNSTAMKLFALGRTGDENKAKDD
jgi:hypothetical protein